MTVIEEGQIQIHTENIFPIIKKAVYSDHEIFLRELVSNSVDAINKRRMAAIAGDCIGEENAKINIKINRENKTLTISDNGIGMTSDEVKKYINQVAFSSAEEFLEKYKQEQDGIIGHFGLGFYSSFMVAKNVELLTKSAKEDSKAVKWSCDGSPNFSLEKTEKPEVGTDVVLHLMEEELEYIEPTRIKTLIKKYCDFMPVEVCLEDEVINQMNPPWRKSTQELTEEDYIELYKYLYPFQGEPLFWIHLNTDYPYSLQGILFFPKIGGRADWENGEIKLYCNQVYVSDSVKEVVPRYLLPLRGVIDSTDIPLNVSRSALQTDRKVRSIGNFVAKKISDKLKTLKDEKPSFYGEIWESVSPFIKIGAMEDDKFANQVEDIIIFRTTNNSSADNKDDITYEDKSYTTIKSYLNRLEDQTKKRILYCTDEIGQANTLDLWKGQGAEVLMTETLIDTQFIPWLEARNEDINFQRVDSELDENLRDDSPEIIESDGESKSDNIRDLMKDCINDEKVTIQVHALKGDNSVPAMILLPEQMRRINDIGALMEQKLPGLPDHHVLLVNRSHPLVKGLAELKAASILLGPGQQSTNDSLTKEIAVHLYDMARLSVGGLEPKAIAEFQKRNAELMGKLISKVL
ncbi:molecular chaperone HtpG [Prochlorococcus marinus]|uniref:Heat shock protein HtpG n=1 Tax=Prochlorococcus marinus (strain MIT 9211) TaxID=93059 RepID=A9BAC8_PROM4|nr:molecular chaperone HtpG [Prochlorococcus marinus]ABX08790.1 heat shock protein HtpG [Prochlorococcus marinus str. MIT 9211]